MSPAFHRRAFIAGAGATAALAVMPAAAEMDVLGYIAGWRAVSRGPVPTIGARGQLTFQIHGPFTGWGSLAVTSGMAAWEARNPDFAEQVHLALLRESATI